MKIPTFPKWLNDIMKTYQSANVKLNPINMSKLTLKFINPLQSLNRLCSYF